MVRTAREWERPNGRIYSKHYKNKQESNGAEHLGLENTRAGNTRAGNIDFAVRNEIICFIST